MAQNVDNFLDLLRIGLGGIQKEMFSLTTEEWKDVQSMAKQQTVSGILCNAIDKLPQSQRPDRKYILQLIALKEWIKHRNEVLDLRAKEVTEIFAKAGFQSCVLKGQSVAKLYTDPTARIPGDIDLWVDGKIQDVISFVRANYKTDCDCDSSAKYMHINAKIFDDVDVEVHYRPSYSNNPLLNKRLQAFFESNKEDQFSKLVSYGYNSPTVRFDCIYSLSHIFRHFKYGGIGIRQLIDYYYILQNLPIEHRQWVLSQLHHLKMIPFLGAVEWVLSTKLGLEDKYLICPMNDKFGLLLLDEIFCTGNFGHYDSRMRNHSHLQRFYVRCCRSMRIAKYCPLESLWDPLVVIKNFVYNICK